MVSYPRRLQMRRLRRAVLAAVSCLLALVGAAALAHPDRPGAAAVLLLAALGYAALCRHWLRLAARSAVGARSEADVRRVLAELELEGWRMRHSLRWPGGGDIDHVAIAPAHAGIAVAVETKTRTYTTAQLARTAAMGAWLENARRSWCPHGAQAVLCVARARGLETLQDSVLVVSPDRLLTTLRIAAGTIPPPAFLASMPAEPTGPHTPIG